VPIEASITDSLVTFATNTIDSLGLPGIVLLCAADSMGIPIAAAAIMLFAGFNVSDPQSSHHFTLVGVVAAGVIGDILGSSIAYAIGYSDAPNCWRSMARSCSDARAARARRALVRSVGLYVIPVSRFIPVVRTFIAFPAGAARMVLPLHRADGARGAGAVADVRVDRQGGEDELDPLAPRDGLPRLRRRCRDRRRHHLVRRALAAP
jgi:membrane protein YqaA with SNARE-associated domain